jgi:chromosome segregation ATPase
VDADDWTPITPPAKNLETYGVPQGTSPGDPPEWPPLGGLLAAEGLISEKELAEALTAQQGSGKRLGEILVESGLVTKLALARALALQYGVTLEEETGYGNGLRGELERRKQPDTAVAVADQPSPRPVQPPLAARVASGDGPVGIALSGNATHLERFQLPAHSPDDLGTEGEGLELRQRRVSELRHRLAETDSLLTELEHHAAAIGGLDAELEAAERLLARLGEQRTSFLGLQARADKLEQTLTQATEGLQVEQEQLDGLEERREQQRTLLAGLSGHEQRVMLLEPDLLDYERLLADQAETLARIRQTVSERDERIAALTGALADGANPLVEAEPKIVAAVKASMLVFERLVEQQAVLSDLQQRGDQLEQALGQAGEGLEGEQARLNELSQRRKGQQTRLMEQEQRLQDLEPALLEHVRHIAAQVEALGSLGQMLTERDERIGSLGDALEQGTNRLLAVEKATESGELLLTRLSEQQQALADLETRADTLERTLTQGNWRLTEFESSLNDQRELLIDSSHMLADLTEKQDQQLYECRLLDDTLNKRQSRLSELKHQVADHNHALTRIETQIAQPYYAAPQDGPENACYAAVDLRECQIDYGVARFFPESAARSYEALPISYQRGVVIVAIATPTESRIRAIRHLTGRDTSFVNVDQTPLLEAIETAYREVDSTAA